MANVLVNGVNFSWGNLTFLWYGYPIIGIQGIEIKADQEKENNFGAGNEPISRGRGNKNYEATIKGVYIEELIPLRKAAPNNDILAIPPSQVTVLGVNDLNGQIMKIALSNVEFTEDPFVANQGETKIVTDIKLILAGISWS